MSASETQTVVAPEQGQRVQFGEIPMDYKVRFDRTSSEIAVHEWEIGPRRLGAPPHRHEYEDEIFYVLEGAVSVMQDDHVSTASAGTCVVLPRGHFHTFWNERETPARLLVILAPGRIEGYFERAGELLRPGVPPDLERLIPLVKQYGLTLQFERVPELMAKHGLESDLPMPPNDGR